MWWQRVRILVTPSPWTQPMGGELAQVDIDAPFRSVPVVILHVAFRAGRKAHERLRAS